MEKTRIKQFVEKQIQYFQNPKYNPYSFEEEFTPGLRDLGFRVTSEKFIENHPEFKERHYPRNDAAWGKAFVTEHNLQILGDFVLFMARDDARSCYSVNDINFKWYIAPLKRMAELCK